MLIDKTDLEWILIASISAILVFTFADFSGKSTKKEVTIDESAYENFPLIAWFDTEEKWDETIGDVVKIKYRVFDENSRIWVYNANGYVVHKQPYDRDPKDDGTPRDFTYSWRLYESEWSDEIEPGNYTITLGFGNPGTGDNQRRINITI
jgi:hypothetical protein|tara:strand:- start:1913 stop:2362 length:450 start_codon:yes stop_codon:yes gene_type:complete